MEASWCFCLISSLCWNESLLRLEEEILQYYPAFLGPSSLQGFVPWYSTEQITEEAKVFYPEVQGSKLAVSPSCCPNGLELHHFMGTVAKSAFELHIPTSPSLLVRARSSIASLLGVSSISWSRKLSSMHSRNLLDCFCPAVLSLQ